MMKINPKVSIRLARLSVIAASLLTIGACASTGGYTNSSDDGYYGKKVAAVPAAAPASNTISAPLSKVDTAIGPVIGGNPDNKTLYFFDKDTDNFSTCNDGCAAAWPPFMVADPTLASDTLTMVGRSDGSKQWAIAGKPLYFWAGDQKAGDTTGSAVPDWTVVTPDDL